MHGQPRRLVDHHEDVVSVELLVVHRHVGLFRRGAAKDQHVARPNPCRWAADHVPAFEPQLSATDDRLNAGARKPGDARMQEPVDAIPVQRFLHFEPDLDPVVLGSLSRRFGV